jgi:hypothetical protein
MFQCAPTVLQHLTCTLTFFQDSPMCGCTLFLALNVNVPMCAYTFATPNLHIDFFSRQSNVRLHFAFGPKCQCTNVRADPVPERNQASPKNGRPGYFLTDRKPFVQYIILLFCLADPLHKKLYAYISKQKSHGSNSERCGG